MRFLAVGKVSITGTEFKESSSVYRIVSGRGDTWLVPKASPKDVAT